MNSIRAKSPNFIRERAYSPRLTSRRMLTPSSSTRAPVRMPSPSRPIKNLEVRRTTQDLKINDFSFGQEIGQGKFGKVFMVRHKPTGALFSLKAMQKGKVKVQNYVQQVINQVRNQSKLSHPFIIQIYGFFSDSTHFYLLLELALDGNLFRKISQAGTLVESEALQIGKDVAQAIDAMHSQKIIHRDIKPQNITLNFGVPKICDFGWSANFGSHRGLCGTVQYLAPQVASSKQHNEKVDVWSLGILLYQMISGQTPFDNKQQAQAIQAIRNFEPNKLQLTDRTERTRKLLRILLQKDPDRRPELKRVLVQWQL